MLSNVVMAVPHVVWRSTTGTQSFVGGTAQSAHAIVVAWQFTITGASVFNDNCSGLPGGGSPIHVANLSE